ncbi:MAG: protein kinase domain-containing protein, partial [Fimbriiglobus sp.]
MTVTEVPCPSAADLRAFCLGRLPGPDTVAVAAHLDACPRCLAAAEAAHPDSFVDRLRAARALDPTPLPPAARTAPLGRYVAGATATSPPPGPPPDPTPEPPPMNATALAHELAGLADYRVTKKLGEGGMGAVYLARNPTAGKDYVLKVIRPAFLAKPGMRERFVQEIQAAVTLGYHPNVVTACPPLSHRGALVHVMEFVDGYDLAKLVADRGPLPVAHACVYVGQAARGLQHAFAKGLVHRDIKPANLLVAREKGKLVVKVADFGLAKSTGQNEDGLTGTGSAMGTPDFMAPEQARDAKGVDVRADVYSLGCTLYYLLTARVPFPGGTDVDKFIRHVQDEPTPVRDLRPDVPAGLAAVIDKMMAKRPEHRYQTPADVLAAVAPFAKGSTPSDSPPPPAPPIAAVPDPAAETDRPVATVPNPLDPAPVGPGERPPTVRPGRRPPWTVAVAAVVFGGLVVAAAGVFRMETEHGTLIVRNVPPDASVYVDGKTARVTGKDGTTLMLSTAPGEHQLRVVAGGVTMFVKDGLVTTVDGRPVEVVVEPNAKPANPAIPAGGPPKPAVPAAGPPKPAFVGNGPRPPALDCTGEKGVSPADVRAAQAAWAKYLGTKVEEEFEIAKGTSMAFVLIPPGLFWMGSPDDEKGRDLCEELHRVRLTKPFYQ